MLESLQCIWTWEKEMPRHCNAIKHVDEHNNKNRTRTMYMHNCSPFNWLIFPFIVSLARCPKCPIHKQHLCGLLEAPNNQKCQTTEAQKKTQCVKDPPHFPPENSVKNGLIFGIQHPNETLCQKVINLVTSPTNCCRTTLGSAKSVFFSVTLHSNDF